MQFRNLQWKLTHTYLKVIFIIPSRVSIQFIKRKQKKNITAFVKEVPHNINQLIIYVIFIYFIELQQKVLPNTLIIQLGERSKPGHNFSTEERISHCGDQLQNVRVYWFVFLFI